MEDIWSLTKRELVAAVDISIKILTGNFLSSQNQIRRTRDCLRSTQQGRQRYEQIIREQATYTAPGGQKSKVFPTSTTDNEVREFLKTSRTGDLEDLNLSCTAITDVIFDVIIKLPSLKTLNLMTTVRYTVRQ